MYPDNYLHDLAGASAIIGVFGGGLVEGFRQKNPRRPHAPVPRLGGAYAWSFARLAWEPDKSVSGAALGTIASLGLTALFNIGRELTGLAR